MNRNKESSRPSIEEIPLTPTDNESFSPSSVVRDSIITYTTDLGSSVESMIGAAEDIDIREVEKKKPTPLGQNPSKFYHQKRFWAICTAITVILAAVFIPLLFLVIVPSIAQKAIDNSELKILSMNITDPTNDGFDIEMSGQSLHSGNFDATLTFTGPLSVNYESQPIGTISSLEPIEIKKGQGLIKGSRQKFKITNLSLFEKYASDSMTGTLVQWSIQGVVSVRSIGITTKNLKLNKVMNVPGAGGFSQNELKNLKVSLNPDQTTLHLEMETSLDNPSPMGMEIGNMHIQVQYNDTVLAKLTSNYFILTPGVNLLTLAGDVEFPTDGPNKDYMTKLVEAFVTNNQPVNVTGKGLYTVLRGGVTAGWLNSTIQNFSLQTVVGNQSEPLQLVKKSDFGETNLVFTPETAYAPLMTSKGASVDFVSPFDMPFEIETIQQNLTIYFQGKPVIEFDTPLLSVTSNGTEITFDVPSTPMKAFDDAHDLFSDFFVSLSTSKSGTEVLLVGKSSIKAKTPVGEFLLDGVPFKMPSTMQGFNLFGDQGSQGLNISQPVLSGDLNQLSVDVVMTITNPTKVGITIGPVNLQIFYQDQQIGTIAIENLSVVPGYSPVNVRITINNLLQHLQIFGNNSTVNIKGYDGSTNIDSLKKLFLGVNVPLPLPNISKILPGSSNNSP